MNPQQTRVAAIEKLREAGVSIHKDAKSPSVVSAISKLTGRLCPYNIGMTDFMRSYLKPVAHAPQVDVFRPLKVRTHPRLTEIHAGQPPMLTPCGTGNYREFSKGIAR